MESSIEVDLVDYSSLSAPPAASQSSLDPELLPQLPQKFKIIDTEKPIENQLVKDAMQDPDNTSDPLAELLPLGHRTHGNPPAMLH